MLQRNQLYLSRNNLLRGLLLLLSLFMTNASLQAQSQIRFIVVDGVSGDSIQGAVIRFKDPNGISYGLVTDASGIAREDLEKKMPVNVIHELSIIKEEYQTFQVTEFILPILPYKAGERYEKVIELFPFEKDTIQFIIIDLETRKPIPEVFIEFEVNSTGERAISTTGDDGAAVFVVNKLDINKLSHLFVMKEGYLEIRDGGENLFIFNNGQRCQAFIELSSVEKQIIQGRVVDKIYGMGVEGATVIVRSYENGRIVKKGLTDSDGGYFLTFPKREGISLYEIEVQCKGYKIQIKDNHDSHNPIKLEKKQ